MQNKNWQKISSLSLIFTFLFSIVSQFTIPLSVYAEEVNEEPTEEITEVQDDSNIEEEVTDDEVEDSELIDETAEDEGESLEEPEEEASDTDEVESFEILPQAEPEEIDVQADENFELSIMHMNDTHAHVENYPKMLTAVNNFRSEKEDSLLFHAGDVFSGTLYFTEFQGQADLALMNLMGFDAMTYGNHEFDLGGKEGGHESLANFVEGANFPFLGTNVDFSGDPFMGPLDTNATLVENPDPGKSYNSIVKEVNGEKVGIFGLTTEDTANIANPVSVKFANYITTAEDAVAEFEAAGIDKIVAVTHIGYNSAPAVGNDLVLAENVDGIDVIVGGHSHTTLEEPTLIEKEGKASTVIVQTGQYADNLGTLTVEFDENGEVVSHEGELVPVKDLNPDPQAEEVLQGYKEQVDAISSEEIGAIAKKDLLNPRYGDGNENSVRGDETELGNLVTDAMLAKAKEKDSGTVIAFQNGGGIRVPIMEGPITTGEVIEVLPFGNDPVIAELSGQEIKGILEESVSKAPNENGGFLHVSGMQFYYDSTREVGDRVVQMYLLPDGIDGEKVEINPEGTEYEYKVTTNNFTGQGGDGHTVFAEAFEDGRVKDIGEIDWEQLRDYMVEEQYLNGEVDPVIEGRIHDLLGEDISNYPNKTVLQGLVNNLNNRKEENYTPETWAVFAEAMKKANDVLETGIKQKEINNALTGLLDALEQLEKVTETDPTDPEDGFDKTVLEALVAILSNRKEENYTAETWSVFAKAMENAKSVLANEDATQKEIDDAANGLLGALEQLEKVSESTPTDPGEDDNGDGTTPGGNGGGNGNNSGGTGGNGGSGGSNGSNGSDGSNDSDGDKDGNLPQTGTNDYIYLVIGVTLLSTGAVVYIINKKKQFSN